jgi:hypothetical protein
MEGAESVPLTFKMLPELLKSKGYRTSAMGKWNLGKSTHDTNTHTHTLTLTVVRTRARALSLSSISLAHCSTVPLYHLDGLTTIGCCVSQAPG